MEEKLKVQPVFGSRSSKCFNCANYAGAQAAGGLCRVWGAVVALESPLVRQCPHWSCQEPLGVRLESEAVPVR